MFCSYCGSKLDDGAVVCPNCGAKTGANPQTTTPSTTTPPPVATAQPVYEPPKDKSNTIAIVGFIMSFFVPIAGLICSIIGFNKAKKEGLDHQGLALAGIILSALSLAGSIISTIIGFAYYAILLGFLAESGSGAGYPYALLAMIF